MKIIKVIKVIFVVIIILQISTIQCIKYPHRKFSTHNNDNELFISKRNVTDDPDSKMLFGINCMSNDTIYCGKIIKSFNDIGKLLSSIILFNQTLMVSVTIDQACVDHESDNCVNDNDFIGYAYPGSIVLLEDDLGVERFYQQPLAKQFFSQHPDYGDVDIYIFFANRSDYWFQGDPLLSSNQKDFSYLILREIIPALGFFTSWDTSLEQDMYPYLVPRPYCENYDTEDCETGDQLWISFKEFIFDKYLINLNTGDMLSNKTIELNKIFGSRGFFGTISRLTRKLKLSYHQFEVAKEVYQLATKSHTMGFLSWNDTNFNTCLVLETNLLPFDSKISINHVDNTLYNNTSDFLMRYELPLGKSLQNEIILGGNYANGTLFGSIGPKLRRMFETLGYATIDKPFVDDKFKPKIPPTRLKLSSLGHSSLSFIIYQQYLILIFVIFFTNFIL